MQVSMCKDNHANSTWYKNYQSRVTAFVMSINILVCQMCSVHFKQREQVEEIEWFGLTWLKLNHQSDAAKTQKHMQKFTQTSN